MDGSFMSNQGGGVREQQIKICWCLVSAVDLPFWRLVGSRHHGQRGCELSAQR